jgi:hypothetical protein
MPDLGGEATPSGSRHLVRKTNRKHSPPNAPIRAHNGITTILYSCSHHIECDITSIYVAGAVPHEILMPSSFSDGGTIQIGG